MKLSASIICKNEEAVIERCIRSFMDVTDEIIVVDTGSTDRTVEILHSLGVQVYHIEWKNDFSYARNEALSHCTGDWVFYLDADEYFEPGSAAKLRATVEKLHKQKNPPFLSLSCKLTSIDPTNGSLHSEMTRTFCFKRKNGIRFYRRIHEQLFDNGKALVAAYLPDVFITHTGYVSSDAAVMNQKHERNDALLQCAAQDGTADATDYYYLLSRGLETRQDPALMLSYANKMIELIDSSPNVVSAGAAHHRYILMAEVLYYNDHPLQDVIAELEKGRSKYPHHPEIYAAMAKKYLLKGYVDQGVALYEQAIGLQATFDDPGLLNNFLVTMPDVRSQIALHLLRSGLPLQAMDQLLAALKQTPYHAISTSMLLYIIQHQPEAEIVVLLDSIYHRNSEKDVHYLVQCLCLTRIPNLLLFYTKEWESNFSQRNASTLITYLSLGKFESAARLALENLEHLPTNNEFFNLGMAGAILADQEDIRGRLLAIRPEYTPLSALIDAIALDPSSAMPELPQDQRETFVEILVELLLNLPDDQAYGLTDNVVYALGQNDAAMNLLKKSISQRWRPDLAEYLYQGLAAQCDDVQKKSTLLHLSFQNALLQNAPQRAIQYHQQVCALGIDIQEMDEYVAAMGSRIK